MKLKEIIPQYIAYRRSLGEKFETNARVLNCFLNYAGKETALSSVGMEICTRFLYAAKGNVSAGWFCKYSALKGFFTWAMAREYVSTIPLPVDIPKRPQNMRPYLYSQEELQKIFSTALTFQVNRSHIHPEVIRMILVATYTLGLRLHETVSLKIKDVDLENSLMCINESKFYKSRIVPFNKDIKQLWNSFMEWRKRNGQPEDSDISVFLDKRMHPMNMATVRNSFERIRMKADIHRYDDSVYQPRIHDLRHTFAVNRLTSWYKEGKDVQKLLPVLSVFLGHKHLAHTSVYLTMTENLLNEANKRFESYINSNNHE
jgi:site-specific recombinase XerD